MNKYIRKLTEIPQEQAVDVGGKGVNLAALFAAGFQVPPGFCITTHAYREFLQHSELEEKIASKIVAVDLAAFKNLHKTGTTIRAMLMANEIPEEIQQAIVEAYRELHPLPPTRYSFLSDNTPLPPSRGDLSVQSTPNNSKIPLSVNSPLEGGRGVLSDKKPILVSPPQEGLHVAVRSSATAEDLPEMSYAGQHDTYLNVSGEADLLRSIKKCWVSLWSDRAMAYRHKNKIEHTKVLMAVVVQQMAPSEVSGILFTAHPVTHDDTEIFINANWGLGESVVSGKATPDEYTVDKETLRLKQKTIAAKTVMLALRKNGIKEIPVPSEQQAQPCLADEQLQRLAALGKQIETHFQAPQDVEWGLAENQIFILQSRPITTFRQTPASVPVVWYNQTTKALLKDSVVFWSNFNVRETLPYPLTPLSWSYFSDLIFPVLFKNFFHISRESPLYPYYSSGVDLVYGRLYWNMNLLYGHPIFGPVFKLFLHKLDREAGELFTPLYKSGALQPARMPKGVRAGWTFLFQSIRLLAGVLLVPWLFSLSTLERRYTGYWQKAVEFEQRDLTGTSNMELLQQAQDFTTASIDFGAFGFLVLGYGGLCYEGLCFLTRKWEDVAPDKLVAGIPGNKTTEGALELYKLSHMPESLKQDFLSCPLDKIPAMLAEHAEGQPFLRRLNAFLESFGHRGPKEFDVGQPRWQDDPTFVFQMMKNYLQLDHQDTTPLVHFQQKAEERKRLTALVRQRFSEGFFAKFFPLNRWLFEMVLQHAHTYLPFRENPKYYALKCFSGSRRIFAEIGRRLWGEGYLENPDDVYFLMIPELEALFKTKNVEQKAINELVRQRKHEWESNLAIEPPFVVRSDGKLVASAEHEAQLTNILTGSPVSSGKVTGKARVILDPADGSVFNKGEILVAPFTDPGWTPLFLTAKALVMETGGILCHGAIVAREYGIPAVVGVKHATKRIKTGDEITVDGNHGRVFL